MNGGGYFAMVRSRRLGIKIYFWSRDSPAVPQEILKSGSGGGFLYPDASWGVPAADFPMYPDLCNYDAHFNAHQIVFDLTFCVSGLFYLSCPSTIEPFFLPFAQGDWAGNTWPSSGCGPGTCVDCKRPIGIQ